MPLKVFAMALRLWALWAPGAQVAFARLAVEFKSVPFGQTLTLVARRAAQPAQILAGSDGGKA